MQDYMYVVLNANRSELRDIGARPGTLKLPDLTHVRRNASQWLNGHVLITATREPRERLVQPTPTCLAIGMQDAQLSMIIYN